MLPTLIRQLLIKKQRFLCNTSNYIRADEKAARIGKGYFVKRKEYANGIMILKA
jgi:hypothetical protein